MICVDTGLETTVTLRLLYHSVIFQQNMSSIILFNNNYHYCYKSVVYVFCVVFGNAVSDLS